MISGRVDIGYKKIKFWRKERFVSILKVKLKNSERADRWQKYIAGLYKGEFERKCLENRGKIEKI